MVERLTPLPDIAGQSERLRMDLGLPLGIEIEAIGVDIPRVHLLMDMGGISNVRMAAATDVQEPPGYSIKRSEDHQHYLSHNIDWCHIQILLNTANGNVRKSDSWAPRIDTALRGGIRKAGTDHLLHYYRREQIFYALGVNILVPAMETVMDKGNVAEFLLGWGSLMSMVHLLGIAQHGLGKNGAGYRLSVLPGLEADRVFLLQILARTAPLVTAMKFTRNTYVS